MFHVGRVDRGRIRYAAGRSLDQGNRVRRVVPAFATVAVPPRWSVHVRLSFPNGEHADVKLSPGEIRIGSDPDNEVVLQGDGVRPRHASVVIDRRGTLLRVQSRDALTHLNSRPVIELALLRVGDLVTLDAIRIALKPQDETAIKSAGKSSEDAEAEDFGAGSRVALRGLSGRYFGRAIPLLKPLTIGCDSKCDIVLDSDSSLPSRMATLEISPVGAYLRGVDKTCVFEVNGVERSDVTLHGGDQIAFDQERFALEAPGLPARGNVQPAAAVAGPPVPITQTLRAITAEDVAGVNSAPPPPEPEADEGDGPPAASPWLLVLAGALIAAALAMLFLHGSGP